MAPSRRSRRRKQAVRRHRMGLERLEERLALSVSGLQAVETNSPSPIGPVGTLVADLNPFTELLPFKSPSDSNPGVAVTSLSPVGGTLWFTTNAGNTWQELSAASLNSATVLLCDANSRIYYEPPANFVGQVDSVFGYQLWNFGDSISSGSAAVDLLEQGTSGKQPLGSLAINNPMTGSVNGGGKIEFIASAQEAVVLHNDGLEVIGGPANAMTRISLIPSETPPAYSIPYRDVVYLHDNQTVAVAAAEGLIVDVGDQAAPVPDATVIDGYPWSIARGPGEIVAVGRSGGTPSSGETLAPNLLFYDVSDRSNPTLVGELLLEVPSLFSEYTDQYGQTQTYEVLSDLEVHGLTYAGDGFGPNSSGDGILFVSCLSEAQQQNVPLFYVVDASVPSSPQIIAEFSNETFGGFTFSGTHAVHRETGVLYVAGVAGAYSQDAYGFVAAFDVSDPTTPTLLWQHNEPGAGFAHAMTFGGGVGVSNLLYVGFDSGLHAYRIGPEGLVELTAITDIGKVSDVIVSTGDMVTYVVAENALYAYSTLAFGREFSVGIEVTAYPPPALASFQGLNGFNSFGEPFSLTIKGSGFNADAVVTLAGSGSTAVSYTVVDDSTITLTVAYDAEASESTQTVTVTNPDGQFSQRTYVVDAIPGNRRPEIREEFLHEMVLDYRDSRVPVEVDDFYRSAAMDWGNSYDVVWFRDNDGYLAEQARSLGHYLNIMASETGYVDLDNDSAGVAVVGGYGVAVGKKTELGDYRWAFFSGHLSESRALVLRADEDTLITIVPVAGSPGGNHWAVHDHNLMLQDALLLKAWDGTDGVEPGSIVSDVSGDAFSLENYSLPIRYLNTPSVLEIIGSTELSAGRTAYGKITLTDPDNKVSYGSTWTATPVTWSVTFEPTAGFISWINYPANNTHDYDAWWVYEAGPQFDGSDSFVVRTEDQLGGVTEHEVVITEFSSQRIGLLANMAVHENRTSSPVSYYLPAVGVDGVQIEGGQTSITVSSSNHLLIPQPTVIYSSPNVPASISFTPAANVSGTATISIEVEDGGADNDLTTVADNGYATHQVEVKILEIISDVGGLVLSQDEASHIYAATQPIMLEQQQAPSMIKGFAAIGAEEGNVLLVERSGTTHRLVTDDGWRISNIFDSLRNYSSTVLRPIAREPVEFALTVVPGAYEIDSLTNPTLTVHRGQKVTFDLDVTGHPFYLQTTGNGYAAANVYAEGFSGNGQTTGRYEWIVPEDAPDELFYQCEFHPVMFGKIVVVD